MIDPKKFRQVNKKEYAIITNSVFKISTKILSVLEKENYKIYINLVQEKISKENYPSIFLIHNNLAKNLVNFQQNINVNSAGLYFGFIKKGEFYLSLEGADFLLKSDCFSKNQQIHVNKSGEKSILYGNKISKSMTVKVPKELQKNSFLLVFNLDNELIALAKSQVNYLTYQNLNHNDLVAINLVDKGYYLRKKQ
jgi:ribosome biogenesis protein Nip4